MSSAWLVLGEEVTPGELAGALLVVGGVLWGSRPARTARPGPAGTAVPGTTAPGTAGRGPAEPVSPAGAAAAPGHRDPDGRLLPVAER